jgi:thioesterase domain-containing protein
VRHPGGDLEVSEANEILRQAHERAAAREEARVPIDYDRMNKLIKKQRAALTRAVKSGDKDKVVLACRDAVHEWDKPGAAWPDDWSRWQRALDDTLGLFHTVQLEDLR